MTATDQAAAEVADYTPEKIRYYLGHWEDLKSIAEGATGSIAGSGRGNAGDRKALAVLLADVESAADALPLDWDCTLQIYRLQSRGRVWAKRRLNLDPNHSLDEAILRMARHLGWRE